MPNYRTTALVVALLAAPAALAADTPAPGAAPEATSAAPAASVPTPATAAAPAQPATPATTAAPERNPQPPGAAASAAVPPAHHTQIAPHRAACLTKSEQRIAVASHQAIPLGEAIKSLRRHGKREEVVRARLCRRGEKLAYVLTLFGHSGRVFEVGVDAASGDLIAGR